MLDEIYSKLMDQESKGIFKSRLIFSLTGDYSEICRIVAGTKQAREIRRRISETGDGHAIIWGTGFWGDWMIKSFPDINWVGYADNFPKESVKNGLPVYKSLDFLSEYQASMVVIATTFYNKGIHQQLLSSNIGENRIIDAGKLMLDLFDSQYFDLPCLPHTADEIFVDAGCFDGLTVHNFIKWSNGNYKEILAFEPDGACYEKCSHALVNVENLTLENVGLWSREDVLHFRATGASDSKVDAEGEVQIRVGMLDNIAKDKKISFIKMDIEGAEKDAIIGAKNIIASQKPKMAVSIYHKREDIWEIPKLLLEINPDYRFYIRHYSFRDAETVLYAI